MQLSHFEILNIMLSSKLKDPFITRNDIKHISFIYRKGISKIENKLFLDYLNNFIDLVIYTLYSKVA